MTSPGNDRQFQHHLAACALFATCLIFWGCPEEKTAQPPQKTEEPPAKTEQPPPTTEQTQPRYPSVVFAIPRCYDQDPATKDKCKDWSSDLYVNLDYLEKKSDSPLWQDITGMFRKGAKFWRLNVFRTSTGELEGSTFEEDKKTDWKPVSDPKTVRMKELTHEVLLRAIFEFCFDDDAKKCDEDSKAKIEGRNIQFIMHLYPEPMVTMKKKQS